ncbi:polysaccharide biosynthesis/export family protein [Vibrio artabrorum]|uniref:polysaccharide biosynthesis/export family protein n=1 Tax=Vibrio artabrorum TaxID=446374 RepID=UPI0035E9DF40
MNIIKLLLLACCVLISSISFAETDTTAAPEKEVQSAAPVVSTSGHPSIDNETRKYFLRPGDMIRIWVYGEEEMSMSLKISKRGVINFPFIGLVQLSGQTTDAIEQDIETRLKDGFVLSPMVSVTMEEFRKFYLLGEVENPNGYEYEPQLTVEQAIAMAGGFTDRADESDINIRPSGQKEMIKNVEMTDPVYPGDVVIVEKSFF